MSSARGLHWPVALAVLGVVLLLAGVARLTLVWIQHGAGAADPEASVLGVVVAATGAAVALLGWVTNRRRAAQIPATAEQVDLAAATLAGAAREQWIAEAQACALNDPEPIPVRWRLTTPDLMDHPAVINSGGLLTFLERSDQIGSLAAAFRALPRPLPSGLVRCRQSRASERTSRGSRLGFGSSRGARLRLRCLAHPGCRWPPLP
jgi:hypothetical protein